MEIIFDCNLSILIRLLLTLVLLITFALAQVAQKDNKKKKV